MACCGCWDFEVAIICIDAAIRLPVSRPRRVPAVRHELPYANGSFRRSSCGRSCGRTGPACPVGARPSARDQTTAISLQRSGGHPHLKRTAPAHRRGGKCPRPRSEQRCADGADGDNRGAVRPTRDPRSGIGEPRERRRYGTGLSACLIRDGAG